MTMATELSRVVLYSEKRSLIKSQNFLITWSCNEESCKVLQGHVKVQLYCRNGVQGPYGRILGHIATPYPWASA